jgi:hypothetical protein
MTDEMDKAPFDLARKVKQEHEAALLEKANVIGVGIGLRQQGGTLSNEVVLVVLVRKKIPSVQLSPEDLLPVEIDGIPVDVQEMGEVRAGL